MKDSRKDCLQCAHYIGCTNPGRDAGFYCASWAKKSINVSFSDHDFWQRQADPSTDIIAVPDPNLGAPLELVAMLDELMNPANKIPFDLKIDDRDLPEFPNFFDFCMSKRGANQVPYARQLALATHLLGEYCVAKGSYLFTSRGMVRIEDLVHRKYSSLEGLHTKHYNLKVASTFDSELCAYSGLTKRKSQVYSIKTSSGHRLKVTGNHLVRILTKDLDLTWVRADEIKIGDYVLNPVGHDIWSDKAYQLPKVELFDDSIKVSGKFHEREVRRRKYRPTRIPSAVTPELARLTGYLISDGHVHKYNIGFCNLDERLVDDFLYCLNQVFGIDLNKESAASYQTNSGDTFYDISFSCPDVVTVLEAFGFPQGTCYTKIIPDYILQSTRDHVIACVRAIIDCDGTVDDHTTNGNRVLIGVSSPRLIQQIHLIMQNLGIYGIASYGYRSEDQQARTIKIKRSPKDRRNLIGTWQVSGAQYLRAYAEIVGSLHSRKALAILNLVQFNHQPKFNSLGKGNLRPSVVPFGKELAAYAKKLGGYNKYNPFKKYYRNAAVDLRRVVSDKDCRDFLQAKDPYLLARLLAWSDSRVALSRVTSVKLSKSPVDVYDLTVPSTENFVANGTVVHNCPKCSHPRFRDITRVPVDFPAASFPDKVQFLEHGVCPKCKTTRSELYLAGELNFYSELGACLGQRSGKTALLGILSPYITHKYMKLQNPAQVFGLMQNTSLVATFTALTYAKAVELLWMPIHNVMTTSPWYEDYHQLLAFYANKYDDEDLCKVKDSFIHYKHRGLLLHPSGPSKRIMRGATRYQTVIDELGWFSNDEGSDNKERASASEVYTALDRSLKTVRVSATRLLEAGYHNIPNAYAMNISSPSSLTDKIMSIVRTHANSRDVLTLHLPTWEFNPTLKKKDFAKEYRDNAVTAERDYGANPPMNESPFISDMEQLVSLCSKHPNRVSYKYVKQSGHDKNYRYAKVLSINTPTTAYGAIMAIDAGYSDNSFALAVGHRRPSGECVIDALIEVAPKKGVNVINYSRVFKLIVIPLIQALNVQFLAADRWQSIKLLQDAEEECGIKTEVYSLTLDDFIYVRDHLLDEEKQSIVLPRSEIPIESIMEIDIDQYPHCFVYKPVAHLLFQALTVSDTGRTIEKGRGLTDDLFRATVLALAYLLDDEFVEEYLAGQKARTKKVAIGAYSSVSGGSTANASMRSNMGAVAGSGGSGGPSSSRQMPGFAGRMR